MSEPRRPSVDRMSGDLARRISLAAQGFGCRPSSPASVRHIHPVLDRVAVLQLDPIGVLCRSHYLPVRSRLGPYSRELLDRMAWGGERRELFEYWGHQASLLPLGLHPLPRWPMHAAQDWNGQRGRFPAAGASQLGPLMAAPWAVLAGMMRIGKERPTLVAEVLAIVAERGPVAAGDAHADGRRERRPRTGGMWNWGDVKIVLEWLSSWARSRPRTGAASTASTT